MQTATFRHAGGYAVGHFACRPVLADCHQGTTVKAACLANAR